MSESIYLSGNVTSLREQNGTTRKESDEKNVISLFGSFYVVHKCSCVK